VHLERLEHQRVSRLQRLPAVLGFLAIRPIPLQQRLHFIDQL
jgi:hypothetical protein